MSAPRPVVLSFAASDPTSGAGLQADLLTIASLGAHPASVITAITVQDTHGVQAVRALEADLVAAQAQALLADMPAAAFKLGVLGSADNASTVAAVLASHPRVPAVIDPVLASARGDALADAATLETLRERLLPRATVLTPNSLEARQLANAAPDADLADCARRLCAAGCRYVLVTGTHEAGPEVVNTLYGASGAVREDRWPRLAGSFHGSGCTLASALAVFLARGLAVPEAARRAQDYTWRALEAGYRPGGGQQIADRLFASR
jgi:hydroxymethylpyrimidine/phosphomethylpyrimidine kinase